MKGICEVWQSPDFMFLGCVRNTHCTHTICSKSCLCAHTATLVPTHSTLEAIRWQSGLSPWGKKEKEKEKWPTDARTCDKTRTQMLLEPLPLPFSHCITPTWPQSDPLSLPLSFPGLMCSAGIAGLFSSCQGWINTHERTASPLVCQISTSERCLDIKDMPAKASRHSGWTEIKENPGTPCTLNVL